MVHKISQNGPLLLSVSVDGGRLLFQLQNQAGSRHHFALEMQTKHGCNMVFDKTLEMASIGSSSSTFLGMGEIQMAADAMGATSSLFFYAPSDTTPGHVLFSLHAELVSCQTIVCYAQLACLPGVGYKCACRSSTQGWCCVSMR